MLRCVCETCLCRHSDGSQVGLRSRQDERGEGTGGEGVAGTRAAGLAIGEGGEGGKAGPQRLHTMGQCVTTARVETN